MSTFLWVALDALNKKQAETLQLAELLAGVQGNFGFKINLDYLLLCGLRTAVANIASFGRPVFADVKIWNGSRTMIDAIDRLVAQEVRYLNVYALADTMLPKAVERAKGSKTEILGVTVLTHYNEAYCQKFFRRSLPETVRLLSETALERGCHGVILPGTTMSVISDLSCKKMNPGIRPAWFKDDRHEEETLPADAVKSGATDVVCGSPVVKSDDPKGALVRLLGEMQQQ